MNSLIVYYSYTGNNRLLAQHLARTLECDLCPLVEVKKRTKIGLFLDIALKRLPLVKNLDRNLAHYENIIFVAPLWASKIASPMRTLLMKERDSILRYSFVTLCGGYEIEGQKEKVIDDLTRLVGRAPTSVYELRISDLFPPEKKRKIRFISRYHANQEDLSIYSPQIHDLVEQETH